jgi:hypothetical protein
VLDDSRRSTTERRVVTRDDGSFEIRGVFAGRQVTATWTEGRLSAEPDLLAMARAVAEVGDTHISPEGIVVAASLDTLAGAVIAISRALDRLDGATVHIGLPG